jgi:hypothetical protein
MELVRILPSLIPLVAPLLIFAACCYYLSRIRAVDSIFLTAGSGIGVLMTALFTYLPYYAQSRAIPFDEMSRYYTIGGFVSLAGSILFTLGLFMLIEKVIKLTRKNYPDKDHYQF